MQKRFFIIIVFVVLFSCNAYSESLTDSLGENINNKTELSMIVQRGEIDGRNTASKTVKLPTKTFILAQESNLTFRFPYKYFISQLQEDWLACLLPTPHEKTYFVVLTSGAVPSIDIFDFKLKNINRIHNSRTLNEFVHEIKNMTGKIMKKDMPRTDSIFPTSFELLEIDGNLCLFFINYKGPVEGPFFFRCDIRTEEIFKEFYFSDFFSSYCPENIKKVLAPPEKVSPSDLYYSWKECSDERINVGGDIINKAKIAGLYYRYWAQGISRKDGFSIIKESLIDASVLKKAAEGSGISATPLLVKEEMERKSSKLPLPEQQKLARISQASGYKNLGDYIQCISKDKYVQEMFAISKYLEPQISAVTVNADEVDTYYKENVEKIKKPFTLPGNLTLPPDGATMSPNSIILNFMRKKPQPGGSQKSLNSLKDLRAELIAGKPDSIQQLLARFDIEVEWNVDKHSIQPSKWQKIAGTDNILIGDLYSSDGKEKLSLLIAGSWQDIYYKYASEMLLREKVETRIHEIIEAGKKNLSISIDNEPVDFRPSDRR